MHSELRDRHDVLVQLNLRVKTLLEQADVAPGSDGRPFCASLALHNAARAARLAEGVVTLVGAAQADAAMTLLRPQVEAFVNAVYVVAKGEHGKNCLCSERGESEWLPKYEKKIEKVTRYLESRVGDDASAQVFKLFSKQGLFDTRNYDIDEVAFNKSRRDFVNNLNAAVHSERAIMQHHLTGRLVSGKNSDPTACQVVWISTMLQMNNGAAIANFVGDQRGYNTILGFIQINANALHFVRPGCCS